MALCTSLCPILKAHARLRGHWSDLSYVTTCKSFPLCLSLRLCLSLSLSGFKSEMEGRNVAGGVTKIQILINSPNFETYPVNLKGSTCGILRLGVMVSAHPPS